MTLTDDITLPTPEEIKHQEIPLTHNYMLASAMWLGKYCDNQSKEYMLCRSEEADPRKCLEESRQVTECGLQFFRKLKKACKEELEWYNKCLDFTGREPSYRRCRPEQAIFDGCMHDNGFERARFGHFQMLRVHDSERPKPKPHVPIFPDSVEPYDMFAPENAKPTSHGNVGPWFNVWTR